MTPSGRVIRELLGETELHRDASPPLRDAFIDLRHKLARAERASAKRDGIEQHLVTRLGYPRILIPDGTPTAPRFASTLTDLDRLMGERANDTGLRRTLRLELRARSPPGGNRRRPAGSLPPFVPKPPPSPH